MMLVLGQVLGRLRQVVNLSVTLKTAGPVSKGRMLAKHRAWSGYAVDKQNKAQRKLPWKVPPK